MDKTLESQIKDVQAQLNRANNEDWMVSMLNNRLSRLQEQLALVLQTESKFIA